jgi:hypothetical protein
MFDVDGKCVEEYRIGSHRTCRDAAREANGILLTRLSAMLRVAKEGPGRLESEEALCTWDADVASARAAERTTSTSKAITWWLETIKLWDHPPAEFTVCHPRLVWSELYSKVYVREMELWGAAPPLRSKPDDNIIHHVRHPTQTAWLMVHHSQGGHARPVHPTHGVESKHQWSRQVHQAPEPRRPLELRRVQ